MKIHNETSKSFTVYGCTDEEEPKEITQIEPGEVKEVTIYPDMVIK